MLDVQRGRHTETRPHLRTVSRVQGRRSVPAPPLTGEQRPELADVAAEVSTVRRCGAPLIPKAGPLLSPSMAVWSRSRIAADRRDGVAVAIGSSTATSAAPAETVTFTGRGWVGVLRPDQMPAARGHRYAFPIEVLSAR